MKKYQVILICNESVNNESLSAYTEKFLETIQSYDKIALINNVHLSADIKTSYPIQGKIFVNVICLNMELEHSDNLGMVLKNIARKYHQTSTTFRICILNDKNFSTEIYDIIKFRKSLESKIYS